MKHQQITLSAKEEEEFDYKLKYFIFGGHVFFVFLSDINTVEREHSGTS